MVISLWIQIVTWATGAKLIKGRYRNIVGDTVRSHIKA
jgi:hypothetical protein